MLSFQSNIKIALLFNIITDVYSSRKETNEKENDGRCRVWVTKDNAFYMQYIYYRMRGKRPWFYFRQNWPYQCFMVRFLHFFYSKKPLKGHRTKNPIYCIQYTVWPYNVKKLGLWLRMDYKLEKFSQNLKKCTIFLWCDDIYANGETFLKFFFFISIYDVTIKVGL